MKSVLTLFVMFNKSFDFVGKVHTYAKLSLLFKLSLYTFVSTLGLFGLFEAAGTVLAKFFASVFYVCIWTTLMFIEARYRRAQIQINADHKWTC